MEKRFGIRFRVSPDVITIADIKVTINLDEMTYTESVDPIDLQSDEDWRMRHANDAAKGLMKLTDVSEEDAREALMRAVYGAGDMLLDLLPPSSIHRIIPPNELVKFLARTAADHSEDPE
jgi:hypothetical protein